MFNWIIFAWILFICISLWIAIIKLMLDLLENHKIYKAIYNFDGTKFDEVN